MRYSEKQIKIVSRMENALTRLKKIRSDLKEENEIRQFDFTNAPRLSELSNQILDMAKKIDDVVYQKKGG